MRLTPERETEIREWRSNHNKELGFMDILLAEIDALREELSRENEIHIRNELAKPRIVVEGFYT